MPGISKSLWNGLRRRLQDMAYSIVGKEMPVYAIPRSEDCLGYTSSGGGIHVAYDHEIIDKIPKEEKKTAFITGVFAHELMHQILTPFEDIKRKEHNMPREQREIYHEIHNVMEDPAIEAQAKYYIGGTLLDCLHYSISTIFQQTTPLQPSHPYVEFFNAMIMYGDGGTVKGKFSSSRARRIFYKAVPIMDKAIAERDGTKRIGYAYEVFLLAKPLWESTLANRDLWEKLRKEISKIKSDHAKNDAGTGDSPMNIPADEDAIDPSVDKKARRRKLTLKKISKEEMDRLRQESKNNEGDDDDGEGDLVGYYCEENEAPEEKTSSGSPQMPADGGVDGGGGNDPSNANDAPGASESHQKACDEFDVNFEPDYDKEETVDDADLELDEETLKQIERMVNDIKQEATAERTASDTNHAEDLSESAAIKARYDGARCLNNRVKNSSPETLEAPYARVLLTLSDGINFLVNHMKRIIKKDTEEREYRNSGRLNVKRLNSGRLTSRVFNRKIDPANTSDMCIEIIVDESGSMGSGNKDACAMQCCIGLAEAFSKLHIPVKIIGFTADMGGYDVTHYHYMHWLNTKTERMNLLSIKARCDNFDGYSIRYATEQILKRKEQHKTLIIISDGAPAALYYSSKQAGIEDTIDAIKQAKKKVDVIGVGVGNAKPGVWESMYGNDFVHVKNANDLFKQIGYEIQKKMKKWE